MKTQTAFDQPFEWHLNVQDLKPLSDRIKDVTTLSGRIDTYLIDTMRLLLLHSSALFPSRQHDALINSLKTSIDSENIASTWDLTPAVMRAAADMRKDPDAHRGSVRFYENYLNVRLNGLFTYVTEMRLWMTADVIEGLGVEVLKAVRMRMGVVRGLEEVRWEVGERLSFELKRCSMEDWDRWVDAAVARKEEQAKTGKQENTRMPFKS